jgi:lipopolysaccharide cholinephosphotransferase
MIIVDNRNKKELSLKERQALSVEVLDVIDEFCKSNSIKYFLNYGTLLGAVRYEGFIPWDDDIDIGMPRPDYERFIKTFSAEGFSIHHYSKVKKLACPFVKVYTEKTFSTSESGVLLPYSIWVDIFPIDGCPKSEKKLQNHFKKQVFLFKYFYLFAKTCECHTLHLRKKNFLVSLIKIILRYTIFLFIKSPKVCALIDKNAKKYDYSISDYVGCYVAYYKTRKEKFKKEFLSETTLKSFEGKKYPIPKNYHEILTALYGDYMTPPPKQEQNCIHSEKSYWK